MPVDFSNVNESTKRSLHNVLSWYFVGGNTRDINDVSYDFFDCDIVYDIREIDNQVSQKPVICIAGDRSIEHETEKCMVGLKVGYEKRFRAVRSLYVSVYHSKTDDSNKGSLRTAERVYDQLLLVVSTQKNRFEPHNIFNVELSSQPRQVVFTDTATLSGRLSFDVRYQHTIDRI